MTTQSNPPEITLEASVTLATYQFHIMTLDTNGRVKLAVDADDPVMGMLGILQNKPTAIGQGATIRISGVAKVMGGDTVAPGIWVTTDASGHAVACADNDNTLGITLESMASGKVSRVLLAQRPGYKTPDNTP